MGREMRVPRVLLPVLLMIPLAMVVNGLEAQDRNAVVRSDAPNIMTFRTGTSGAYLGVVIREVNEEDAERLNLSEERGALVAEVPDDGPAAGAGIRADDVIVSWNGSRIESAAQLSRVVRETPPGRSVELRYIRERRERTVSLELAESASGIARMYSEGLRSRLAPLARARVRPEGERVFSSFFLRGGRLGVGAQSLGDQLAEYFGASEGGVLVASVTEDSPAEAAGLRAGDVIVSVGGDKVEDPGDLMEEIWEAEEGEIEIRVLRDRQERTLRATLPERDEGVRSSGNSYYFGPRAEISIPDVIWDGGFQVEVPEMPTPVPPSEPAVRT